MFGRFSVAKSATLVPAPYGGVIDGSQFGGGDQTVKVYSGALSWTRIYSTDARQRDAVRVFVDRVTRGFR